MKNMMKKILPLVLSVLFCLSASTTAFAAGGRTQETDVKTIVVNQDTLNLNATDVTIVSYPAYKVRSYSTSFSSNKRTVACTWRCSKYISKNVVATGDYTLSCTFTAGGGNIYPVV